MVYDAKLEKPMTNEQGISDPVNVFTTNNMVLVAWWDENDNYWHTIDGETFGSVKFWTNIEYPIGWYYNSDLYGGAV